jgi:hypothetical protein
MLISWLLKIVGDERLGSGTFGEKGTYKNVSTPTLKSVFE